jgi:hypothetical protein
MLQWSLQQTSSCLRLPTPKSAQFLTWVLHGGAWSTYTPVALPQAKGSRYQLNRRLVRRFGDTLSQSRIEPRIHPACHYTDWAIPTSAYEAAATLPVCLSPRHSLWWHRAVWYMVIYISEESIASVFKVFWDISRVARAIVPDVSQVGRTFICSVTFQKTWIFSSATLRTWNLTFISYVYNKVGVIGCSETVATSYQTPRWHHPESHNCRESLKSQNSFII